MTDTPAEAWASTCQNCGTPLADKFCAHCGQRAIPPRPTLRELGGDAWEELVGWDGKVARTLKLLLARPGELTAAVLEGRRARYISPVRLYLVCSLLYFLAAGSAPAPEPDAMSLDVGVGIGTSQPDAVDAVFAKAAANGVDSLTADERAALEAEIARNPAWIRPLLRSVVTDPEALESGVLETLPKALFVLIPALALAIALFYRGRHFPEHLYAALHLQSFVFLVLAVVALTSYATSLLVFASASAIAGAAILAYAVIAQRRVYGGSWVATAAKAVCIGALYALLWVATSFGVSLWVAAS